MGHSVHFPTGDYIPQLERGRASDVTTVTAL
jgi:hypothetical protein